MAKITAIRVQASNASRANVFLDGEYAFSLHIDLAIELRIDQELTEPQIAELRRQDAREIAYGRALHYLSFRPRSEREVARYLAGKGVDDEADVEAVLERLRLAGLVDDRDFARFWVGSREGGRPKGIYALRSELRLKGVADEHVEAAVSTVDEPTSAYNAAARRAERLAQLDEDTFRRRLVAFLMRRGFGYAVARETTDKLWGEHGARQHPDAR